MSPDDVSRDDLMWLAGYLEGEGCFGLYVRSNRPNPRPVISVNSIDYDVIARVHLLFNITGTIVEYKPRTINHLYLYRTSIQGYKAIAWMKKLLPFMSNRRQETIKDIIQKWDSRPIYKYSRKDYAK